MLKKYEKYLEKKEKNINIKEINNLWWIINIKQQLSNILQYYPDTIDHYFNRTVKWILLWNDKIYIIEDKKNWNEIWFIILKNTEYEKKIRTIYINEQYRNKWNWILFMKIAIDKLWISKPHYTVPEELWPIYSKIVKKFWHKVSEIIEWLYRKWKKEYIINWKLKRKEWY